MEIDPETVSPSQVYSTMIRAITPRPIAWVSTESPEGVPNLAPFSYFNGVCSQPATLMFSAVNKPDGSPKDTVRNIKATSQFVVNVVPFSQAQPMAKSAGPFEYEENEFEIAGLTQKSSIKVKPGAVAESPIQFECELMQVTEIGEGPTGANVIFGKILLIRIDDAVLGEDGKIAPELLDNIGRLGGMAYSRTHETFELKRG